MNVKFNNYKKWDSIILSVHNKLGESVKDKILMQFNLMFEKEAQIINIFSISIISSNEHYFRVLVSFAFEE